MVAPIQCLIGVKAMPAEIPPALLEKLQAAVNARADALEAGTRAEAARATMEESRAAFETARAEKERTAREFLDLYVAEFEVPVGPAPSAKKKVKK
jgi:hypothetical protein